MRQDVVKWTTIKAFISREDDVDAVLKEAKAEAKALFQTDQFRVLDVIRRDYAFIVVVQKGETT